MNIFVTHDCPIGSAKYVFHDYPKRGIKMILECAQLMSTAMHLNGVEGPYRPTHKGHPCTLWTAKSYANFMWVYRHYLALAEEYTKMYGKTHKCLEYSNTFVNVPKIFKECTLTPFANCARNKSLGVDFTDIEDVHLAYREYLKARKELM